MGGENWYAVIARHAEGQRYPALRIARSRPLLIHGGKAMLIYDRRRVVGTYKLTREERERMPIKERRLSKVRESEVASSARVDYMLVPWVKMS